MSLNVEARFAETQDRQRLIFALFIFMSGLAAGVHALEYYYHRHDYAWMNMFINGLGITQVLIVVLLLVNLSRMLRLMRSICCSKGIGLLESFVGKTSLLALGGSWFFTWFIGMGIMEWTEPNVIFYGPHDPASLFPPAYYFQLLLCCMLLSYSVVFLLLYWRCSTGEKGGSET